jgi:hypothetical protein
MNTKLIIVDGHCSVGKSSVSKSVWKQLSQEQDAYWLHEECEHHPIREGEFRFGALETPQGMEANRVGMLQKWADFRESILASGQVCVTEGCLLHAYDRYFIHSLWDEDEIDAYYAQVIEVIRPLNPVLVLLHRPGLRASLEKAFLARGNWWRELMLKRDDLHVYFKTHTYVDETSMFDAIAFEQGRILEIFDRLQCAKLKIDTSGEQWELYTREILDLCGSPYKPLEPYPCDLERYTGRYRRADGTGKNEWVIQYDRANRCLYTSLFWPYMPMRCTAENVFELISFPVALHFQTDGNGLRFQVRGNYDWEINDQWFIKV